MLKTENLTKEFNSIKAVSGLTLKIDSGEIYGFLGANGAGKTTTIKMLTGLLQPTSGSIFYDGRRFDPDNIDIKVLIGFIPDEPMIYPNLKGREYLEFISKVYEMDRTVFQERVNDLCTAFQIDYLEKFVSDYSHGMKQKVMLCSVLMRKPKILFLDEPTVGLDAKSAKILKSLLFKMKEEGCMIFLTTHILEIAEKMCDRIGIIKEGSLIAEGTMAELRKLSQQDNQSLEDIFLELTGQNEISDIIEAL